MINRLADVGTAILVTTHYLEEAEQCNRLGFMVAGELVAEGNAERRQERAGRTPAGVHRRPAAARGRSAERAKPSGGACRCSAIGCTSSPTKMWRQRNGTTIEKLDPRGHSGIVTCAKKVIRSKMSSSSWLRRPAARQSGGRGIIDATNLCAGTKRTDADPARPAGAAALALLLPLICSFCSGTAIRSPFTDLPLVIQDFEDPSQSRRFTDAIRASITFHVVSWPTDRPAEEALLIEHRTRQSSSFREIST